MKFRKVKLWYWKKKSGSANGALHMNYKLSLCQHDKYLLVNEAITIKYYTSMKYYPSVFHIDSFFSVPLLDVYYGVLI